MNSQNFGSFVENSGWELEKYYSLDDAHQQEVGVGLNIK